MLAGIALLELDRPGAVNPDIPSDAHQQFTAVAARRFNEQGYTRRGFFSGGFLHGLVECIAILNPTFQAITHQDRKTNDQQPAHRPDSNMRCMRHDQKAQGSDPRPHEISRFEF